MKSFCGRACLFSGTLLRFGSRVRAEFERLIGVNREVQEGFLGNRTAVSKSSPSSRRISSTKDLPGNGKSLVKELDPSRLDRPRLRLVQNRIKSECSCTTHDHACTFGAGLKRIPEPKLEAMTNRDTLSSRPLPNWLLMKVDEMVDLTTLTDIFPGGRPTGSGRRIKWDKLFIRVQPAEGADAA